MPDKDLTNGLKEWAETHPDDAKKLNDFSKWYRQYRDNLKAGKPAGYRQDINLPAPKPATPPKK